METTRLRGDQGASLTELVFLFTLITLLCLVVLEVRDDDADDDRRRRPAAGSVAG